VSVGQRPINCQVPTRGDDRLEGPVSGAGSTFASWSRLRLLRRASKLTIGAALRLSADWQRLPRALGPARLFVNRPHGSADASARALVG